MRIAMLCEGYFPEVSGVTVAAEQHVRYLAAAGHEVLLVHPDYPPEVRAALESAGAGPPPALPAEVAAFHSAPLTPYRPESRVPSARGAAEVEALLRRFRPELALYKNPDRLVPDLAKLWKPRRVAGLAELRRQGVPAVPIVHTLMPLFAERSGAWLWRTRPMAALTRSVWSGIHNDHFPFAITVDPAAAAYLRAIGFRIPVLSGSWNGVDPQVFRPAAETPRRRAGEPLRVVFSGRLVREKNAHLLPALAAALQARHTAVEVDVLGAGPLLAPLRAALANEPNWRLHGWCDHARMADHLRRADLYLSLSDAESYSLTASEALACGAPVLAPEVLGFRRLAGRDVGVLFPPAWLTPEGMRPLADCLARMTPELPRFSANARAMADQLTWGVALRGLYGALSEELGLPL